MRIQNHVRMNISGAECEHETIVRILGVRPTRSWSKGDELRGGSPQRRKENGCEFTSPSTQTATADQCITTLLKQFPRCSAFRALPQTVKVTLQIAIYSYDERPGLSLASETLAAIFETGAALDVDVYDLSARPRE